MIEDRPLCDEAQAADVLQDAVVRLGKTSKADARPDHKIRLITIKTTPHVKRGKYQGGWAGPGSDGVLRIATNLLDVPAEIIALIFRYRWTIEIFFRFFKHVLGCRHLLSHDQNGIEIQTYSAIIACMLISLWTGRKPTLRSVRDDLLLFYRPGRRGGVARPHLETETARRLSDCFDCGSKQRFTLRPARAIHHTYAHRRAASA